MVFVVCVKPTVALTELSSTGLREHWLAVLGVAPLFARGSERVNRDVEVTTGDEAPARAADAAVLAVRVIRLRDRASSPFRQQRIVLVLQPLDRFARHQP